MVNGLRNSLVVIGLMLSATCVSIVQAQEVPSPGLGDDSDPIFAQQAHLRGQAAHRDPRAMFELGRIADRETSETLRLAMKREVRFDELPPLTAAMTRDVLFSSGLSLSSEHILDYLRTLAPSLWPFLDYYSALFAARDRVSFEIDELGNITESPMPADWRRLPRQHGRNALVEYAAARRIARYRTLTATETASFELRLQEWCSAYETAIDREYDELRFASSGVPLSIQAGPGLTFGARSEAAASIAYEHRGYELMSSRPSGALADLEIIAVDLLAPHRRAVGERRPDGAMHVTAMDQICGTDQTDIADCAIPGVAESFFNIFNRLPELTTRVFDCEIERWSAVGVSECRIDSTQATAQLVILNLPVFDETSDEFVDLRRTTVLLSRQMAVAGVGQFQIDSAGQTELVHAVCFIPLHIDGRSQDALIAECIARFDGQRIASDCPYSDLFDPQAAIPSLTNWNFYRLPSIRMTEF